MGRGGRRRAHSDQRVKAGCCPRGGGVCVAITPLLTAAQASMVMGLGCRQSRTLVPCPPASSRVIVPMDRVGSDLAGGKEVVTWRVMG